jgi:ankyrin repeat protein
MAHGAASNTRWNGNDTLLHVWAAGSNNIEVADLLLSSGCDVNAQGNEGETPLHVLLQTLAFHRNQSVGSNAVLWLLDHKANLKLKNAHGKTPLSMLIWRNRGHDIERRKDIADLLRKHGATE